jgi:hypothetical protein
MYEEYLENVKNLHARHRQERSEASEIVEGNAKPIDFVHEISTLEGEESLLEECCGNKQQENEIVISEPDKNPQEVLQQANTNIKNTEIENAVGQCSEETTPPETDIPAINLEIQEEGDTVFENTKEECTDADRTEDESGCMFLYPLRIGPKALRTAHLNCQSGTKAFPIGYPKTILGSLSEFIKGSVSHLGQCDPDDVVFVPHIIQGLEPITVLPTESEIVQYKKFLDYVAHMDSTYGQLHFKFDFEGNTTIYPLNLKPDHVGLAVDMDDPNGFTIQCWIEQKKKIKGKNNFQKFLQVKICII